MLLQFGEFMPEVEDPVFIAPGSYVIGQVWLGAEVSIWFNTVVRADSDRIAIGAGSNIQDNSVIHVDPGVPVTVGRGVTVGHRAILHGVEIGDESLIGMGSILMNHVKVGSGCIIGAGSLLTEGTEVPDGMLAFGSPARVVRPVTPEEQDAAARSWKRYRDRWIGMGWKFR